MAETENIKHSRELRGPIEPTNEAELPTNKTNNMSATQFYQRFVHRFSQNV